MYDLPPSTQTAKMILERATDKVRETPERGMKIFKNRATVEDGMKCRVKDGDWTTHLDMPGAMGGTNTGPTPGTMLRAGYSACIAIGIKIWAARAGLPIDQIAV